MKVGAQIWGNTAETDRLLRATFSALTRYRMGRTFSGTPTGWYQIHQCAAIDVLEERLTGGRVFENRSNLRLEAGEIRVVGDYLSGRVLGRIRGEKRWRDLGLTPNQVFNMADRRARGYP